MKKNILVIGGAGYLGAVLVKKLLTYHYYVTVLDNYEYSDAIFSDYLNKSNFTVIRGDFRNITCLNAALQNQNVIIPLAALVGQSICDRKRYEATVTNVDTIELLLRLMKERQILIYPSTQSCFGQTELGVVCTENTPISPISHYARTKSYAEQRVLEVCNTTVLRFGTLFGVSPRMRTDLLINHLVFHAVKEKKVSFELPMAYRNYLHVLDAADAVIFAMNNFTLFSGEIFNVGSPYLNLTKIDICERIKKYVPHFTYFVNSQLESKDKRNYFVSVEKILNTGWYPTISLDFGIEELISEYMKSELRTCQ